MFDKRNPNYVELGEWVLMIAVIVAALIVGLR